MPVFLVKGWHEAPGSAQLAEEWFAMLDTSVKARAVAETSGHRPNLEQPEAFHQFLPTAVLVRTRAAS